MARISTGTGDDGTTGLVGGTRVRKTDARVAAYGAVDEANDALGLAAAFSDDAQLGDAIRAIQAELFMLGADLAAPAKADALTVRVTAAQVARIGSASDELEARLPPLTHFILPGGTRPAAFLQLARSIIRRAERDAWHIDDDVNEHALVYLNRLSDLLFLMARDANHQAGVSEPTWSK